MELKDPHDLLDFSGKAVLVTGSSVGIGAGHAILTLTAGQWLSFRLKNTQNDNDATAVAGNVVVAGRYAY